MRSVQAVIPCYNLWDLTSALLHSLMEAVDPGLRQIVLVDNGSSDETQGEAPQWEGHFWDRHRLEFVYLRYPMNLGFSAAINAGWRYRVAGWDSVVFNNDMLVRPGWLTWLQLALDAHPALGMVSASLTPNGVTPEQWRAMANPSPEKEALQVKYRIYDLPWLFRGECIEAVGEFDEGFKRTTWEDHDYLLRMSQAGWEWGRCFNSVVYHHWNQTQFLIQKEDGNQDYFLRNRAYFARKHGGDNYLALVPPIQEELKRFL